jgi:hypothetical protein
MSELFSQAARAMPVATEAVSAISAIIGVVGLGGVIGLIAVLIATGGHLHLTS